MLNKLLHIVVLVFTFSLTSFSQNDVSQHTNSDTLIFNNSITVVQTTIKHLYNDAKCEWLVSYPQLQNSGFPEAEVELNKRFIDHARIGDCADDDKECNDVNPWYPNLSSYWNLINILNIDKNIVTYTVKEGGTIIGYDKCFGDLIFYMYDLNLGTSLWEKDLILNSEKAQQEFENLILQKIGRENINTEYIRTSRQLFVDKGKVYVFYDKNTIKEDEEVSVEFTFDELKNCINDNGLISKYYELKP